MNIDAEVSRIARNSAMLSPAGVARLLQWASQNCDDPKSWLDDIAEILQLACISEQINGQTANNELQKRLKIGYMQFADNLFEAIDKLDK